MIGLMYTDSPALKDVATTPSDVFIENICSVKPPTSAYVPLGTLCSKGAAKELTWEVGDLS